MVFTTAAAQAVINKLLRNTDFAQAAALFVSIHSDNPGNTGANEITGYTGTRKAVTFTAPSGKATSNNADITFADMPATTVTYIGLWDAAAAGVFWGGGALTVAQVCGAGETLTFLTGDIDAVLT